MCLLFDFFVILSLLLRPCDTANILFLSEVPSFSHHLWLRTVAEELATRGHNITFVSCDADKPQRNLHFIHMEKVYETVAKSDDGMEFNIFETGIKNVILQYFDTPGLIIAVCDGLTQSNGWQQLNDYPNDFQIPMSFLERIINFVLHMLDSIIWNYYTCPKLTKIIQKTNSFDYLVSVANDPVLFLTNYDPAVDEAQQLPPNVIGVGGLQIKTPSTLPDELQTIADEAVDGLILFSLGTNMHSQEFGESIITNILESFEIFPEYTFFCKIDLDKGSFRIPDNVVVRKWFPQKDVLAHKNTKLFITHGGLLSTQEAIWYGVPMLGIPIFFDQYSNIHKAVDKGIAEVLYIKDLSLENICEKILLMMSNPKYKEELQIYSEAFRDQRETPIKRAVWWIEWAMRHPVEIIFDGYGKHMNFLQIESVDVIGFLTIVSVLVLCLIMFLIVKCIRVLFC